MLSGPSLGRQDKIWKETEGPPSVSELPPSYKGYFSLLCGFTPARTSSALPLEVLESPGNKFGDLIPWSRLQAPGSYRGSTDSDAAGHKGLLGSLSIVFLFTVM